MDKTLSASEEDTPDEDEDSDSESSGVYSSSPGR
jgi:hypothetical protein